MDSSTACKACETGKYQELDVATEHKCKFCAKGKAFVSEVTVCDDCVGGSTRIKARWRVLRVRPAQKASMLWTAAQPARHAKLESTKR